MKIDKVITYTINGKKAAYIGQLADLTFLKLKDDHVCYIVRNDEILGSINIKPEYNKNSDYINIAWNISAINDNSKKLMPEEYECFKDMLDSIISDNGIN